MFYSLLGGDKSKGKVISSFERLKIGWKYISPSVDSIIMLIFSQLTKTNENNESQSDWKTPRASWYSVRGHSCGSDRDPRTAPPAHTEVCCSSQPREKFRFLMDCFISVESCQTEVCEVKRDMIAIKHEIDSVQLVKDEIDDIRESLDRLEAESQRRKNKLLEQVRI